MRRLLRLLARLRRRPLRTITGIAQIDLTIDRTPVTGTVTYTAVDTAKEDDE